MLVKSASPHAFIPFANPHNYDTAAADIESFLLCPSTVFFMSRWRARRKDYGKLNPVDVLDDVALCI